MKFHCKLILKQAKKLIYTFLATRRIGGYEEKPNVNHRSFFTKNTFIGKNCHFNGINIQGGGKVTIGDNFHSGTDILIITQNHDYDHGSALPYGKEYLFKPVIIEDNV